MSTGNKKTENKNKYIWVAAAIVSILLIAILANKTKQKEPVGSPKRTISDDSIKKMNESLARKYRGSETKDNSQSIFISKYAGEYNILVDDFKGSAQEKLFLENNGSCAWKWIENGRVLSTKFGTWTAEKGIIYTVVQGNSGPLPEDFRFTSVAFRSGHRYLKLRKKL